MTPGTPGRFPGVRKLLSAVLRREPDKTQRGDIQGLRALAVGLVIGDHVFGAPTGGFLGVDIFFVVSGFLITSMLLDASLAQGRVDFVAFYRRRIRRLVPMATLVLLTTVVGTLLVLGDARGADVALDAVFAFGFVANWRFASTSDGYFADLAPTSPLQHYWSLSVEEQFYLVWPVLIAAILLATRARRGRRHSRRVAGVAVAGIGLASFAYSFVHSSADPQLAYFSTLDRAWELAAGAALAAAATSLHKLNTHVRGALFVAGLLVIGWGVWVIDQEARFPTPWAGPVVIGTLLILASGSGAPAPAVRVVLDNGPMRYLGDISYSLYLWHFPVLVLSLAFEPALGLGGQIIVLALVVTLSVASYHLVEKPVRRSTWLEPRRGRGLRSGPANHSQALANGWIGVIAVIAVVLVLAAVRGPIPTVTDTLLPVAPRVAVTAPGEAVAAPAPTEAPDDAAQYLQQRLQQALDLDAFPDLTPDVAELGIQNWLEVANKNGCLENAIPTVANCISGDPDGASTVLVLGDSYGAAYRRIVDLTLPPTGVKTIQLTMPGCPDFDVSVREADGSPFPICDEFRQFAVAEINKRDPDVTIIAVSNDYFNGKLASGATGSAAVAEAEDGLRRTLSRLDPRNNLVVFLSPPPGSENLQTCLTKVGEPADCERDISAEWYDFTDMQRRVAAEMGAYYIDTRGWFCVSQFCPAFVGTTPIFADGAHITPEYSEQLGEVMRRALVDAIEDFGDRQTPGSG